MAGTANKQEVRVTQVWCEICYDDMSDSFKRIFTYERSFFDTIVVSDNLFKAKAINLALSDMVHISDTIEILGVEEFAISWVGGTIEFYHKPYWKGLSGSLDFNYTNLSFRSGHYSSYINDINDERLIIVGFEDSSAMSKLTTINGIADAGYEITVHNIGDEYNGVYIIESVMYKPLSLDVFEYQFTLRFVRKE